MLLRISLRNIWRHKVRTLIVGGLIIFGTVLVIVGNAVIDAIDAGMMKSIVQSLAGHIQVYGEDSKDSLSIYGEPGRPAPDLERIDDFFEVSKALKAIDGVDEVIPMGINFSIVFGRNILDNKLEALRRAVDAGDREKIAGLVAHLRRIIAILRDELSNLDKVAQEGAMDADRLQRLQEVSQDAWWEHFDADALDKLEILENDIAPLQPNDSMIPLRYVGTDPQAFKRAFGLFEIVDGEMIPPGQRGFLFNKRTYERFVKHRVAYQLDQLERWHKDDGRRIASDEEMQTVVKRMVNQYRTIVFELDPSDAVRLKTTLSDFLQSEEQSLDDLVKDFLAVDDDTLYARHSFFYEHIAPKITEYRNPIGSYITLTSFTRGGYVRSVNVKIYGTYRFVGMERSTLAGAAQIMDMMSFRQLYGFVTPDMADEIEQIKKDSGVTELAREDAEMAMFGDDSALVDEDRGGTFDEFGGVALKGRREAARLQQLQGYTTEELERGPVLNMAVFVKDPTKIPETQAAIESASKAQGLGLKTVDWNEASGLVGKFTSAMRFGILLTIFIIFIVALIIINNSMVMATTERVREVGTLRAIGGQRGFILRMFLVETLVLCFVFGVAGALLGSGIVLWLGSSGIPAFHDVLYFLFAGPSLQPVLYVSHVVMAFGVVFVVALLSTLYPAWLATRITPVSAMRGV